jgi:hypothetical protein
VFSLCALCFGRYNAFPEQEPKGYNPDKAIGWPVIGLKILEKTSGEAVWCKQTLLLRRTGWVSGAWTRSARIARNVWIVDFRWSLAYCPGVGVGLGGRRCGCALALIC